MGKFKELVNKNLIDQQVDAASASMDLLKKELKMKINKTHRQPIGTILADTSKLQQIMHYHGLEGFLEILREAYFAASDEMEDIDLDASEAYRTKANEIGED